MSMPTDRTVTADDVAALKARLGTVIDAWAAALPLAADPDPVPPVVQSGPANPAVTPGDGRAVLTWDAPEGSTPTGYRYGRDGEDATGAGPWSGLLPPSARTATLDKLVNGRSYLVSLAAVYPDREVGTTRRITPAGITPPPDPDPAPPAGTAWLSGVADNAETLMAWSAFRGAPTTYARVWADTDRDNQLGLYAMADVTSTGWDGVLDLACGGPSDWSSAATGGHDATWRAQCRKALALWGNLKRLHLSMAHEFNNGYPWIVAGRDQGDFRRAWSRWYEIVQDELVAKGKDAKVVLSCNADSNSGWTVAAGLPDPDRIDIIGVDFYDFWPSLPNQQAWDANKSIMKGDTPRGVQAWIDFAARLGKPISFPEWGLAPSGPFAVNNPFFIAKMNETFASIAATDPYDPGPGKIAGEAYFNAWDGHGRIWPTAINVGDAQAKYRELTWGSTAK